MSWDHSAALNIAPTSWIRPVIPKGSVTPLRPEQGFAAGYCQADIQQIRCEADKTAKNMVNEEMHVVDTLISQKALQAQDGFAQHLKNSSLIVGLNLCRFLPSELFNILFSVWFLEL